MENDTIVIDNLETNGGISTIAYNIPYSINRNVIKQNELDGISGYDPQNDSIKTKIKNVFKSITFLSVISNICPVIKWLPRYHFKEYIAGDIIAGFTVAVFHIPQGMAYGLLAGLDPVVGLYMAFFPTLVYFAFGTSRHVSTGTFSIASVMVAKIVLEYSDPNYGDPNLARDPSYSNYQVATAVTLACAFLQLIMYSLRLGVVTTLLSEALISGFTTAAAIQVVVIQSKDVLGVKIPKGSGIIMPAWNTILQIPNTHLPTLYVSLGCIGFMILMNEIIKPILAKKCKFPLPAELMTVIGFTIISYFLQLGPTHNVAIVGEIPRGLPPFEFPSLRLVQKVAVDSIGVSVVTYSIMISMALLIAQKDKYEIRANHELLAIGLSNIIGSCFSCIPVSCALSRTIIQHQTGGKTQIVSVVSAMLILILLLWLGPLFETLPKAVLAGIIIVSLKGMLWQFFDIKRYYEESKLDVIEWFVTFFGVALIDIDIGLLIGIIFSLLIFYLRGFKSYSCNLGQVQGTDIYVDTNAHKNVIEDPRVKIFRYYGSINFATCSSFKTDLYDNLKIDLKCIRSAAGCPREKIREHNNGLEYVVIDLQAVPHMDIRGYKKLVEIKKELKIMEMKILLVGSSEVVYETIVKAVKLGEIEFEIFPTVHDAILYTKKLN